MSLFPERTEEEISRDMELDRWKPKSELSGLVLKNFEELQSKYPGQTIVKQTGGKIYSEFMLNPPFEVYSIEKENTLPEHIAYECKTCGGIVSLTPKIEAKNDMKTLSGSSRIDYSCSKCNSYLGRTTFKQSFK